MRINFARPPGPCEECGPVPAFGWTLLWLRIGRQHAQAHAKSLAHDGTPVLLRWDAQTAKQAEYRSWVTTRLYRLGRVPPEPGEPERRAAWEAEVSRHARGRRALRRQFDAQLYGWDFEEDAEPPWRLKEVDGYTGITGAPPLLVLNGGGDLPALLRATMAWIYALGQHVRGLSASLQTWVRCPECSRRATPGRCQWCGASASASASADAHVADALTDERFGPLPGPGTFEVRWCLACGAGAAVDRELRHRCGCYPPQAFRVERIAGASRGVSAESRAAIRTVVSSVVSAIDIQPSWTKGAARAVLAEYLGLEPEQLRSVARRLGRAGAS